MIGKPTLTIKETKQNGTEPIVIERQDHLAICKLAINHRWLWTSCYEVVAKLIGMELEPGDAVSCDINISNVKYLGKRSLTRRVKMEPLSPLGIESKKTNMGVSFVWVGGVLTIVASVVGLNPLLIAVVFGGSAFVVGCHILGHAITDGLVHHGKGHQKPKAA